MRNTYRSALLVAVATVIAIMGCAGLQRTAPEGGKANQLTNTDADFTTLGLHRTEVKLWEDGRRTPLNPPYYEWWYFDGLLDDGTVIVAWLGDNWPYGSGMRAINLEITPRGQATKRLLKTFTEPGSFSQERADTKIGPHSFSGDLATYRIVIDPADTGGLGIDITLKGRVAPYRPGTGHVGVKGKHFAWLVAVPNGEITGTMTIDGLRTNIHGSGYHDHNWGNVSPADFLDNWWWGRAVVGDRTIIVSSLQLKKSAGGMRSALLFMATPAGVEVNAYNQGDATVVEGRKVVHPDPQHTNTIASRITIRATNGTEVVFPISDRLITSANLLQGQNWGVKALVTLAGLRPWYSRFISPVIVTVPGSTPQKGEGTLEFFEFK